MMKRRLFFFILLPGLLFQAAAETPAERELTVDEAVRMALANNLSLQRNAIDLNGKERASSRAWNSLLPSVSASASVSHPTSLIDPLPAAQDRWTPGLGVSASLTLSAAVFENIKKTRADYEAGKINYEQAGRNLELQVRKLFYQLILLEANKDLAAQNLESARLRHEQSAAFARAGQTARLDELSARVDMENQRSAVRSAGITFENALDSFKTLLGIPENESLTLRGTLDYEHGVPIPAQNVSENSPETAGLVKSIESLTAQRNAVKNGAYLPSLRLSWNPNIQYADDIWKDGLSSFSIILSMNLDSFLPWSSAKTQIDDINDRIAAAQIQMTESRRSHETRIQQYLRTIERTRESIEALTLNVELAQTAYDQYQIAYRNGAADYQRLRDASDSLSLAQNRVQQEQYNLMAALLDLEMELNIPFGTIK